MTIQAKLSLGLLGGLLVVLPLAQGLQYYRGQKTHRQLAQSSAGLLQERERANVENIIHALDFAVDDFLARGEMDIFEKLGELRKAIPGFTQFSIYDPAGKLSEYSDQNVSQKVLPDGLKARLYASRAKVVQSTPDGFEVYEPQIVTKSCQECHTDWVEGMTCGVTYFRFSNDAVARLQTQFATAQAAAKTQSLKDSGLVLGILVAVIGGLVYLMTRHLARTLHHLATKLRQQANQVRASAAELTVASQSVADGASQQAASLEETSASLEEVSSMTNRNAEGAETVSGLAGQARQAADQGALEMQSMSEAVDDIKSASGEIAKIIKTIDEIAFQTNLLALNAAVEAARAGDAGMGFAVVAEEVRNLAQRSAHAARETSEKIAGSIQKSENGVQTTIRVVRRLAEIVEKVRKVSSLVAEIATASREQTQGLQQVNCAVAQMDTITQSNAAAAEESATSARELDHQARGLEAAVNALLQLVGGHQIAALESKAPNAPRPSLPRATTPVSHSRSPGGNSGGNHPVKRSVVRPSELPLPAPSAPGALAGPVRTGGDQWPAHGPRRCAAGH